MTVQEHSERWFPYPYPHFSAAESPAVMEYPMVAMDRQIEPIVNVTHESSHNWFPMIVGSNKRVHTWMDEGFNQFIQTFFEARWEAKTDQTFYGRSYLRRLEQGGNKLLESGQVIGNDNSQYFKTAAGLQMLQSDLMGPALFDKGFKTYIERWAYKHPTPVDFFRTMYEAAGQTLDWFWREWFLEVQRFDQAVDSVAVTTQGNDTHVTAMYRNNEGGILPLLVRLTFSDSSTQDLTYPAEIWAKGTMYTTRYTFPGKTLVQLSIDSEGRLVDMDRSNNQWRAH